MASLDHSNPEKLNELDLAQRAQKYRDKFGISDKLYVDIIEILEFKVHEIVPGFRLMIRRDIELERTAHTTIEPPRIYVRETIYDAACEGDQECRRILAHELGHLLLHVDFDGPMHRDLLGYSANLLGMNALDSIEDQADIFARNFLIPPFLAFANRHDIQALSHLTGMPKHIAAAAATISKRSEMLKIRQPPKARNSAADVRNTPTCVQTSSS